MSIERANVLFRPNQAAGQTGRRGIDAKCVGFGRADRRTPISIRARMEGESRFSSRNPGSPFTHHSREIQGSPQTLGASPARPLQTLIAVATPNWGRHVVRINALKESRGERAVIRLWSSV